MSCDWLGFKDTVIRQPDLSRQSWYHRTAVQSISGSVSFSLNFFTHVKRRFTYPNSSYQVDVKRTFSFKGKMLHYCNDSHFPEDLQDNTIIDNTWLVEVRQYNFNTQIFQVWFLLIISFITIERAKCLYWYYLFYHYLFLYNKIQNN